MAIKTTPLARKFKYGSVTLEDPGTHFSPEQVRDTFSVMYPELSSAVVEGPTTKGNTLVYEFRRAVGTKG